MKGVKKVKKFCIKCSGEQFLHHKDVTHVMFGKIITIESTPIFICTHCGREEYMDSQAVDHLIRDAYRDNTASVLFYHPPIT